MSEDRQYLMDQLEFHNGKAAEAVAAERWEVVSYHQVLAGGFRRQLKEID